MAYAVLKETLFDEEIGNYEAYGIECNEGGSMYKMSDLSCECEKVECLVHALNLWELPSENFQPMVSNWAGS